MSSSVETTIACDDSPTCGRSVTGPGTPAEVRRAARAVGWGRWRGVDRCPVHQARWLALADERRAESLARARAG